MRTPPGSTTFATPPAFNLTSSSTTNNNNININPPLHHHERRHHHHHIHQQQFSPTFPPTPPHLPGAAAPLLSPTLARRRSTSPTRPMPSTTRPTARHRAPPATVEGDISKRPRAAGEDEDILVGGYVRVIPSLTPEDDDDEDDDEGAGAEVRRQRAGEVDARLSRVAGEVLSGGSRTTVTTGKKGRETMETETEVAREEVMARLREVVAEKVEGERWRYEGETLEVIGF